MLDLQALVDGMGMREQQARAGKQLTLGGMIEALEKLPATATVAGFKGPHSYRGYYCDLAFRPEKGKQTVVAALALCRSAMGEVFEGYKGGDFQMGKLTPIWLAEYGCCGRPITALTAKGALVLGSDEE